MSSRLLRCLFSCCTGYCTVCLVAVLSSWFLHCLSCCCIYVSALSILLLQFMSVSFAIYLFATMIFIPVCQLICLYLLFMLFLPSLLCLLPPPSPLFRKPPRGFVFIFRPFDWLQLGFFLYSFQPNANLNGGLFCNVFCKTKHRKWVFIEDMKQGFSHTVNTRTKYPY